MKALLRGKLSSEAQRVFDVEINRQAAEKSEEWMDNAVSVMLWTLHDQFGFGKDRLSKLYEEIIKNTDTLVKYYEMDDVDFICRKLLREQVGINIADLRGRRGQS